MRRGEDSERTFEWFTPRKRRATLYEDVTVDTQPSVWRHLSRGWPVHFDDGRGTWERDSTRLRSTDWFEFRDPAQQWERTFYQAGSAYERQVEGAVRAAAADRLFDDFEPGWIELLALNLQVPAFVEHGLWHATATAARDCLSDTVTACVVMQAAMKQRLAQAIVLYAMDLETHTGAEFPIEQAKERWLREEPWQPARRYLERLWTLSDWGETLVAVNLCFEPLVGVLIRRELGIRAAMANGDTVTPVVANTAQLEWGWVRDWTAELGRFLLGDEEHGEANGNVIADWMAEWLPPAREAAAALAPADEALARVERDAEAFHEEAGVAELAKAPA